MILIKYSTVFIIRCSSNLIVIDSCMISFARCISVCIINEPLKGYPQLLDRHLTIWIINPLQLIFLPFRLSKCDKGLCMLQLWAPISLFPIDHIITFRDWEKITDIWRSDQVHRFVPGFLEDKVVQWSIRTILTFSLPYCSLSPFPQGQILYPHCPNYAPCDKHKPLQDGPSSSSTVPEFTGKFLWRG